MIQIVVASKNPVKIRAAKEGFGRMLSGVEFNVAGVDVASGVSHQPMTDMETLQGARNRARGAKKLHPEADYWFGIEGGCQECDGDLEALAWVVVMSQEMIGKARTGTFQLPPAVAKLVREGVELGHADDQVFGRSNSKQTNGAVGLLTSDLIDRSSYYEHAVMLALIPFVNPNLYPARS